MADRELEDTDTDETDDKRKKKHEVDHVKERLNSGFNIYLGGMQIANEEGTMDPPDDDDIELDADEDTEIPEPPDDDGDDGEDNDDRPTQAVIDGAELLRNLRRTEDRASPTQDSRSNRVIVRGLQERYK